MALFVGAKNVSTVFPSSLSSAAEIRGSLSTTDASLDRPGRVLIISVVVITHYYYVFPRKEERTYSLSKRKMSGEKKRTHRASIGSRRSGCIVRRFLGAVSFPIVLVARRPRVARPPRLAERSLLHRSMNIIALSHNRKKDVKKYEHIYGHQQ